jgi:hypothetical protein
VKRIQRFGSGAALGIAFGTGFGFLSQDVLQQSSESYSEDVARCAAQLGSIATQAAKLPHKCESFSDEFKSKVTTVTYRQGDDYLSDSSSTVYLLPTGRVFTEQAQADAPVHERWRIAALALGTGGLGGLIGALAPTPVAARVERDDELVE